MSPTVSKLIMGCVGSRQESEDKRSRKKNAAAFEEQSNNCKSTRNNSGEAQKQQDGSTPTHLQPKISMMSDHTLKLLKEIGELKAFTEIDPADSKINKHLDILMALENPQAHAPNSSGGTTNTKTRST